MNHDFTYFRFLPYLGEFITKDLTLNLIDRLKILKHNDITAAIEFYIFKNDDGDIEQIFKVRNEVSETFSTYIEAIYGTKATLIKISNDKDFKKELEEVGEVYSIIGNQNSLYLEDDLKDFKIVFDSEKFATSFVSFSKGTFIKTTVAFEGIKSYSDDIGKTIKQETYGVAIQVGNYRFDFNDAKNQADAIAQDLSGGTDIYISKKTTFNVKRNSDGHIMDDEEKKLFFEKNDVLFTLHPQSTVSSEKTNSVRKKINIISASPLQKYIKKTEFLERDDIPTMLMGYSTNKAQKNVPIYFPTSILPYHTAVVGSSGTGKSTVIESIIRSLINNNIKYLENPNEVPVDFKSGALILDPKTELIGAVLIYLEKLQRDAKKNNESELLKATLKYINEKVEVITLVNDGFSNEGNILNIQMEESKKQGKFTPSEETRIQRTVDILYDTIDSSFEGGKAPAYMPYLKNVLMILLFDKEIHTIGDIQQFFLNNSFREKIMERAKKIPQIRKDYNRINSKTENPENLKEFLSISSAIDNRLENLTSDLRLVRMLESTESQFKVQEWVDQGKLVLIELSGMKENVVKIFGDYFKNMIFEAKQKNPAIQFTNIMDEAQNTLTIQGKRSFKEGRSANNGNITMTQTLSAYPGEVKDLVIGSLTKIVFGVVEKDAEDFSKSMSDSSIKISPITFNSLKRLTYIIKTEIKNSEISKNGFSKDKASEAAKVALEISAPLPIREFDDGSDYNWEDKNHEERMKKYMRDLINEYHKKHALDNKVVDEKRDERIELLFPEFEVDEEYDSVQPKVSRGSRRDLVNERKQVDDILEKIEEPSNSEIEKDFVFERIDEIADIKKQRTDDIDYGTSIEKYDEYKEIEIEQKEDEIYPVKNITNIEEENKQENVVSRKSRMRSENSENKSSEKRSIIYTEDFSIENGTSIETMLLWK